MQHTSLLAVGAHADEDEAEGQARLEKGLLGFGIEGFEVLEVWLGAFNAFRV